MAATPARRIGTPDEVAALVSFLCGQDAGYINGADIDISGGSHLNTLVLGSQKANRATNWNDRRATGATGIVSSPARGSETVPLDKSVVAIL